MFVFFLVQVLLPVALGKDASSGSSSGSGFGGRIDPKTTPPRRLLPRPGAKGGHLPRPLNDVDGHISPEHGYQGCLGLTDEELTSGGTIGGALASELNVTALPPCQIVVGNNTVVIGIDSSSGGGGGSTSDLYQSNGSISSNESSSGSGSAGEGEGNAVETSSNTYLEQDETYDESGAQFTSGSSQGDYGETGSELEGSQSSSGSDATGNGVENTDEADGTSNSTQAEQIYGRFPLWYFNITECATYSSLWIWDLALTCNSTVQSVERKNGCECTSAEILYFAGDIDCRSPAQQVCPEDCEVCKTCLRLIGCDNSVVDGGANASIPQVVSRSMRKNALPMSVAIVASLVTAILGVNMYQQRKRLVANDELQSALQEDEQDEPPFDPMI